VIAFKKNNPIENNTNPVFLKKNVFSKIPGIQSNKRIDKWHISFTGIILVAKVIDYNLYIK